MRSAILVLALLAAQTPAADTGPFGLSMGMTIDQFRAAGEATERDEPHLWQVTPPRAHSAFATYYALVGPESGLCQIRAVGEPIITGAHGIQVRDAFDRIVKQLADVYGKPKRIDTLLPGSLWDEPEDWMMALIEQERVLAAHWTKGPYKSDIAAVMIQARAASRGEAVLVLQYDFSNLAACKAEIAAEDREVL